MESTPDEYPNYEEDEATFASFIQEHKIQTIHDNDDDDSSSSDSDDIDYEPGTIANLRSIPCYPPHLQRIKNRDYYTDDNSSSSNTNSSTTQGKNTFSLEIPLDELKAWDAIRGGDLAKRATKNGTRYIELFCKVIDTILNSMIVTPANNNGSRRRVRDGRDTPPLRDSIDVLHEQRLEQSRRTAEARQLLGGGGGDGNNGENDETNDGVGVQNDIANFRENGITDEFPPQLMRRYELRILPLGRPGRCHPFKKQYRKKDRLNLGLNALDGNDTTTTDSDKENTPLGDGVNGISLRHVRSQAIGQLVTIHGMIVRSSDVKPCCTVATYTCNACGAEIYQVVQTKREFLPQRICPSCGSKKDVLQLQTRGSKFVKFQELKIQELPSQVPMGHVPRSMSIHCRGEMTRIATPGDVVTIDGMFLPQRVAESGYRAMKAGLISTTYLEAQNIIVHKQSYDDSIAQYLTEDERNQLDSEILEIAHGSDPVGRLSSSIAPEIFGHEDIKRALLLQLVGGCTRTLPDGMRIRGDINICLMGDPGVAKSQLLKHVSSIAPRGVYTTGKGSSGVGLTAAITKDLATGEMALEGGALVLADHGICAIDEFDKMDDADRTAIHEVMEQQTVSIAKAGIIASLNARAAVLAAANPLYSKYNKRKSLSENVNLPNSLLSRFDLMFLVLDTADVDKDMALARHVTFVHKHEGLTSKKEKESSMDTNTDDESDADDDDDDKESSSKPQTVSPKTMREYISRARKFHPVIESTVAPYVVEAYVGLRQQGYADSRRSRKRHSDGQDQMAMTARQLLSILRLSQALARLRFSDYVAREDVDEAIRLTHMSRASLDDTQTTSSGNGGSSGTGQEETDIISRIFQILKDYTSAARLSSMDMKDCEAMVIRKGFTQQQLRTCLEEYEALDVIQMNDTGTKIHFL